MLTPEQVLAQLNYLRKEYDDDKEDPTYQALTHALLFISYQIAAFKDYCREAAEREAKKGGE